MSRLKSLSGNRVIHILAKFGFQIHAQRGSHVKLRRLTSGGNVQILTIPRHRELDKGTLYAIFRQACRFIPEDELKAEFYTE
jgi:predicted RNA binding protein YcfA (HicA-like mRNA interferase family)